MPFTPGLELSRSFYQDAVRPILDSLFPGLPHAAGLIDSGSEVLGFDDPMSTDHHWGPRVMLFLREEDQERYADTLQEALRNRLPYTFAGYPTNFSDPDPTDHGTQLLTSVESGPVNHRVTVQTIRLFFQGYLGFDPDGPLEPADWLTFSEQRLRTVADGGVFHDTIGLEEMRRHLAYYPDEVWLYLLASGWARIGQEEHLMGRAGLVGDEIGSAVIAARLVRDSMRLCFLMKRVYAPYPKWFGTAFQQLPIAAQMSPSLQGALRAATWQEREAQLVATYELLAMQHNRLGLTEPLPERVTSFFGRPFRVMAIQGFSDALLRKITDPTVQRIVQRPPIGGIDQFSDSTDLLSNPEWREKLKKLYG